ncbi:MAG: hypothetical protein IJA78_02585 [Clostridia bacterium]|nr:hypothetical protein [Clostridia bacterium]
MKRILALMLAFLMLCTALAACSEKGVEDGSPSDGGGDVPPPPIESALANADVLALSYDRLENADLSFNFNLNKGATLTRQSTPDLLSASGSNEHTYTLLPEDVWEGDTLSNTYFSSNEERLEQMSREARSLADFAIEHITVMDRAVISGNRTYVLHYDQVLDQVSVLVVNREGSMTTYQEICIYYDADGDETVDMWTHAVNTYNGSVITNTEHVVYCANKTYYIASRYNDPSFDFSTEQYHVQCARKIGGKWMGFSTFFDLGNEMITKEGEYDYANGLLYIEFLIETDGGLYSFTERLIPVRDGNETGGGVSAQPTDGVDFADTYLYTPGITIDRLNTLVQIWLSAFTGWESLTVQLDRAPGSYEYQDEDDTFVLSDGTSLPSYCAWGPDYGLLLPKSVGDDSAWWVDGVLVPRESLDWDALIRFVGVQAAFDTENACATNGMVTFQLGDGNYTLRLSLLSQFMEELGLTFVDGVSPDVLANMAALITAQEQYTDRLFYHLFDQELGGEGYVRMCFALAGEMKDYASTIVGRVAAYETIAFEELPARPQDMSLVSFATGLVGTATLSENGFDFSAMTASIGKTVILSEGKNYGVCVGFASPQGTVFVNGFATKPYALEAMTFTGAAGVAIPDAQEGEYTLKCFFGRKTESGWIRLSEILDVPLADFADFSFERDGNGGYYRYELEKRGSEVHLAVTFVDTAAPTVTVLGATQDAQDPAVFLIEDNEVETVADLLARVCVTDNYDGEIAPELASLTKAGAAVDAAAVPTEGEEYIYVVEDAAGNRTQITLRITAAAVES